MEKLYSHIVGTPIVSRDSNFPIASVANAVVDPSSGAVIAFTVDRRSENILMPRDIIDWTTRIVVSRDDVIMPKNDVFRVQEILDQYGLIIGNRVQTEKGELLGIVFDYLINTSLMTLQNIHTAKNILGLIRFDSRIIPAKEIVEIRPGVIVVKNPEAKEKEAAKESVALPAAG